MTLPAPSIDDLRERVRRLEGRPAAQPVATHPALEGLLQLQTGGVYATGSAGVLGLLMAGPSADGAWCGIVGTARLGLEALAAAGVRLDRCVLVPDPQSCWIEVTAALVDVLGVVAVVPPVDVGERDAGRLAARLRARGSVLLTLGDRLWPRVDARIDVTDVEWVGLGQGHGHLQARRVTLGVRRGTAPVRTRRLWFPDLDQRIRPAADEQHDTRTLRSVG
ncbi:MAG TPA: hypothetical protein VNZ66_10460 [Aeromicrobium sp.]|nr:hypothetical protein [Aeromicrobium sp.]